MKNIVFIHGMFMNPKSWEEWVAYFSKQGYNCFAPAWPFHEGEPSGLRIGYSKELGKLTLAQVVDHVAAAIEKQGYSKAVLVGHSMGGLVTQLLVARGIGSCGICIDSAAPNGMLTLKASFFKSNLPTINPLKGDSVAIMSHKHFHYTFCNTMSHEATENAYQRYVVPESRNVPRSSSGKDGKIDLSKPHPPLLFVAGEKDNIIPASLNEKNARAYSDKKSITDLRIFPDRTHFICGQENWQEVADHILGWLKKQGLY